MYLSIALVVLLVYSISVLRAWRRNASRARASGLGQSVVMSPFHLGNAIYQISSLFMLPLCRMLPNAWTEAWIDLAHPSWNYLKSREVFERYGDTVMVASPGGTYCSVGNADMISQICGRKNDFTKPLQVYKIVDLFGRSIISTEGNMWRAHRKVMGPAFSDRNNALVWRESVRQARAMLATWAGRGGNSVERMRVADIQPDASTLSLHVISKAGFGVSLFWPGEEVQVAADDRLAGLSMQRPPAGHSLTFKDALQRCLHNILWFVAFPPALSRYLPFRYAQRAAEAWYECDKYWRQLLEQKLRDVRSDDSKKIGMDLMARLVEDSGLRDSLGGAGSEAKSDRSGAGAVRLSASDVVGDTFIIMFAGHDTTANSMHFALLGLAINRAAQARLHLELDEKLGGRSMEDCGYEAWYDGLFNGMLGAVINEALRLFSPIINVPKTTQSEQAVKRAGQDVLIPAGTFIHLNCKSVHRDRRYWPHRASARRSLGDDLDDFEPERWLLDSDRYGSADGPARAGEAATRQSNRLITPPHGAFMPFSDGHRACMGRRFATVEMVAVLATILQYHTVELAVDAWASDEEVARMTGEQRKELYQKAIDDAYRKFETGADIIITLKLGKGNEVPVNVVRRGEERFVFD